MINSSRMIRSTSSSRANYKQQLHKQQLKQQLEGKRWHQAHEERHLQRCDDKQQPNDQEHQQRVGHLCNEATTHFQELHCPVSARGARIISSVMIPGRSCHSAQNCQYMSAVMRRSCQNCQYMSTVMRRSCHSVQNCQYMSAIGHALSLA